MNNSFKQKDDVKTEFHTEPVAWYWEEKQIVDLKRGSGRLDKIFGTPIPLYTHPADLTDEEIESIWAEMSEQCDEEFIDMKQFARAILKKASER